MVNFSSARDVFARGDDIASMDPSRAFGQSNFRGRSNLATWCTRFGALFSRTYVYKLREPSAVATQAVNSVLMPLIIGSIFFDLPLTVSGANDRLSAISLIVLMQSFAAFDQLLLFPKERGLFLHESNGGMYSTSVYYWARTIVESVTIILFAVVCACVSYEMFGLDDSADGRITFYFIITAVTMAGAAFLTMIGSICKTFEQTNALAVMCLIVLMMFDGNWINRRNIPVYYRWLTEVSFLGYAVEAAGRVGFQAPRLYPHCARGRRGRMRAALGSQILRSLDFDPDMVAELLATLWGDGRVPAGQLLRSALFLDGTVVQREMGEALRICVIRRVLRPSFQRNATFLTAT